MSLEPRPVGVEPRPADGPAFVLCFQHVSINIIFLSPFAAFPLPHSEAPTRFALVSISQNSGRGCSFDMERFRRGIFLVLSFDFPWI